MNSLTRIGLVLLRIVIGWHFLFEGLDKLDSWYHGPREGHAVWSAGGYLSESQGPMSEWFRQQAGDPDKDALAKLTLSAEPGKLPPAVEKQWSNQFKQFVEYYELGKEKFAQPENVGVVGVSVVLPFPAAVPWPTLARNLATGKGETTQLTLAQQDFDAARAKVFVWFASGSRMVPSKLPGVDEKLKETTAQRIAAYKDKLRQQTEIENKGMPAFDRDVWKENYRTLKKEIAVSRSELLRDLEKPFSDAMAAAKLRLSKTQRDKGPVPEPPVATTNLDRINFITRWGLAIVGACLLMGLFTRTACVAGAGFLLMFALAMPALPWLPANPRAEGHYLFIDKNIIELIALLTLATTRSGKWVGLDGLVQFLNPWRWRWAEARRPKERPQPVSQ
jgi:uncharacterized membrane protein YphA (DoxX/SURF4 family)